jgi:hypothetical protein
MSARRGPLLWAVVAVALVLRGLRAVQRWDEIALAYAAYWQAWGDAVAGGDWGAALTTFTGLHPPGYALMLHLVDAVSGHRPVAWLLLSVACSVGAVWVVGRLAGAAAAAVLALDPFQLAYCAEINNYPLLVLAVALCLAGQERVRRGGSVWFLVAAGVLAGWTHLLGGLVAGLCLLSVGTWRVRLAGLAALAVGTGPVVVLALGLAGEESTFSQSGLDWGVIGTGLWTKSGPWLALLVPAAWACRRRPERAVVLFGTVAAIGLLTALQITAPHQQPYWVATGPSLAVALGGGLPWVAAAAAVGGLAGLPAEAERLQRLGADLERERAVDQVLEQLAPGDALWLLAPALMPDDDKTMTSDVLWRFSPWSPAPAWRGPSSASAGEPAFEFADYGFGQPRVFDGVVVHSSTDLWPEQLDQVLAWHLGAGHAVWFVLYDHGPAADYPGLLQRHLAAYDAVPMPSGDDVGLGRDYVVRVTPADSP